MKKNIVLFSSLLVILLLIGAIVFNKKELPITQPTVTPTTPSVNNAKKIAVYFLADKTTLNPGETAAVGVWFRNTTASETLQLNVGETDINFDQNVFTATFTGNNPCNQSFLYNAQKKTISAGDVYIVCSLGGGDPLVSLAPGGTIKLADFNLTLNSNISGDASDLTFGKINVPDAGNPANLSNLSDGGTAVKLFFGKR